MVTCYCICSVSNFIVDGIGVLIGFNYSVCIAVSLVTEGNLVDYLINAMNP